MSKQFVGQVLNLRRTAGAALAVALIGFGFAAPAGSGSLEHGQKAFRRGDWAEAEKSFLAAVREQPKNAAALKWLGRVYTAQQKFDLAEGPFRLACEIDPREERLLLSGSRRLCTEPV